MPNKAGPWQDFARGGSFCGLAWIQQDVAAFNTFLHENASKVAPYSGTQNAEEWLAAKLMGRWRDGSPIAKFPDRPPAQAALDNDFGYSDDPGGMKCPVAAHIRVANSRDQPLTDPNKSRFPNGPPRLMRRGFSYGPRLEGLEDDGRSRGVVGMFFFARVNAQFYTVLRWINQTSFSDRFRDIPGGFDLQDSLLGNRVKDRRVKDRRCYVPLPGGVSIQLQLPRFIRYRGVVVLFAPSIAALRLMSQV
jgi:deferrochelatase/peroxidase EfeB